MVQIKAKNYDFKKLQPYTLINFKMFKVEIYCKRMAEENGLQGQLTTRMVSCTM